MAAVIAALLTFTACRAGVNGPHPIKTMVPSGGEPVTATPVPRDEEPTPTPTLPPAIIIPNGGLAAACEQNTLRVDLPADAASRIEAAEDDLYLLLDGGLYRIDRRSVDGGAVEPEPLLLPGTKIGARMVQELTDLAISPGGEAVYLLDKAGHIFRTEPSTGRTTLTYRAYPDPALDIYPELVAIDLDAEGNPVALDTAYGALWTPDGIQSLDMVGQTGAFTTGVDLTIVGDRAYVLLRDGSVEVLESDGQVWLLDSGNTRGLGLALWAADPLGVDLVYAVDGLRREIVGFDPNRGDALTQTIFGFGDIGLLRDAVFTGGRLYALADNQLYVYPGPAQPGEAPAACVPPSVDGFARPTLYGKDLIAELSAWTFPIEDGELPDWPRVYPGGSRIYRLGVHHGTDIYYWDAPPGYGIGWPVVAIAAGRVIRADTGYKEMTVSEYERLIEQAQRAGGTPEEVLDRLAGRQVIIEHGNGLQTVYMHLDSIEPGLTAGEIVQAGDLIGTVGVTGTQGEAEPGTALPHLHFEIWVDDRYLGQGVTIREAMWWLEQVFSE